MSKHALGLIETTGLVGAVAASDAAAKHADVRIVAAEHSDGGTVTVQLVGDLASVQAAVEAGSDAARKLGQLWAASVNGNPDDDLIQLLGLGIPAVKPKPRPAAPPTPRPRAAPRLAAQPHPTAPAVEPRKQPAPPPAASGRPSWTELEAMSVVKLRQFARTVENLPIQGRQISMANKTQLLEELRKVLPS